MAVATPAAPVPHYAPAPGAVRLGADLLTTIAVAQGLLALGFVIGLPDLGEGDTTLSRISVGAFVLGMTGLALVGCVLVRRHHRRPMGWLLVSAGMVGTAVRLLMGYGAATTTSDLPLPDAVAWATNWAWVPAQVVALLLVLRFPTGRLPSRGWRWAERGLLLWGAVTMVTTAVLSGPLGATSLAHLDNPYGVESLSVLLEPLLGPLFAGSSLFTVVAAGGAVFHWRRADTEGRQQVRWVLVAILAIALTAPVAVLGGVPELAASFAYLALPAAVAVAVLRHRLWELGLVVRRSVVYLLATMVLIALYLIVSLTVDARTTPVVAAVVVAAVAVPVRDWAQRSVERLLYADRGDPDTVARALARRLHEHPQPVLDEVAAQLVRSLRLPYVGIEHLDGSLAATAGTPTRAAAHLPLLAHGRRVGSLVAHERAPGEGLAQQDLRLLTEVASQAGLALLSEQLDAQLRASHDRVLAIRDEERTRLQRELHDRLGPTLGAIGMRVEAARNLLGRHQTSHRVDEVLAEVGQATESAVIEVRRLLHDLRPSELDELGIEAAIDAAGKALGARLQVDVHVDLGRRSLPPALETAAYRIVIEALHNVARHADAARCRIELRGETLGVEIRVQDDGRGLRDAPPGIGIRAMRGRSEDLGGHLEISSPPTGGVCVEAWLPWETL